MKTPTHNIKRYVTPLDSNIKPYWYHTGAYGWLATGVKDKNGREIFQGDRVCYEGRTDEINTVTFGDGGFWLDYIPLTEFVGDSLEVVGHIAEGKA